MIGVRRAHGSRRQTPRTASERGRIEGRYQPSARELFPVLRARLLGSRPVVGTLDGQPIYGKPTFRNVIDEKGRHA